MIAFFTKFGWSGLAVDKSGIPNAWVVVITVAAGVLTVAILCFLMQKPANCARAEPCKSKMP
jgi:hypothetical protein